MFIIVNKQSKNQALSDAIIRVVTPGTKIDAYALRKDFTGLRESADAALVANDNVYAEVSKLLTDVQSVRMDQLQQAAAQQAELDRLRSLILQQGNTSEADIALLREKLVKAESERSELTTRLEELSLINERLVRRLHEAADTNSRVELSNDELLVSPSTISGVRFISHGDFDFYLIPANDAQRVYYATDGVYSVFVPSIRTVRVSGAAPNSLARVFDGVHYVTYVEQHALTGEMRFQVPARSIKGAIVRLNLESLISSTGSYGNLLSALEVQRTGVYIPAVHSTTGVKFEYPVSADFLKFWSPISTGDPNYQSYLGVAKSAQYVAAVDGRVVANNFISAADVIRDGSFIRAKSPLSDGRRPFTMAAAVTQPLRPPTKWIDGVADWSRAAFGDVDGNQLAVSIGTVNAEALTAEVAKNLVLSVSSDAAYAPPALFVFRKGAKFGILKGK